ncbi:MAG: hypothetical protein HKN80_13150, partial [Acidimicrobiia bacterium]|nr:hypothetical protein [Acidimicrobiia bacterium]
HSALDSFFRLRGLTPAGSAVWEQGSGWWPDLYRFTARTPVGVSVGASDYGTTVRLTARLDRVWRAHLVSGLLAPLALVLTVLGAGPSAWFGLMLGALAWMAVVAWTYQLRREAVQRRLAAALADVSRPAYRLQPW